MYVYMKIYKDNITCAKSW